jgi:hypothetical protein
MIPKDSKPLRKLHFMAQHCLKPVKGRKATKAIKQLDK